MSSGLPISTHLDFVSLFVFLDRLSLSLAVLKLCIGRACWYKPLISVLREANGSL